MKKLSLVFLVLVVLTAPVIGQKYREVDLSVNGVGTGASYSTVVRKFGKPLRNSRERVSRGCTGSAETHLTMTYPGLILELLADGSGRDFFVYSIDLRSKKWSASGVSVGASAQHVVTRFGEPGSKETRSGQTVYYYVTKGNWGGVNFWFSGDKLVRVFINTTLC
jgi:hypothetical protein